MRCLPCAARAFFVTLVTKGRGFGSPPLSLEQAEIVYTAFTERSVVQIGLR